MRTLILLWLAGLALPVTATDELLVEWTRTIARQQAGQALPGVLERQAEGMEAAGGNLLGAARLSLRHENDQPGSDAGYRLWEAGLSLPLRTFRQQSVHQALADGSRRLADAQRQYLYWQAEAQALEWLDRLVRHWLTLEQARARLQQAQELERLVQAQAQAGERSRLEAMMARSERLHAEATLARAEAAWQGMQDLLRAWQIEVDPERIPHWLQSLPEQPRWPDDPPPPPSITLLQAQLAVVEADTGLEVWASSHDVELELSVVREEVPGQEDHYLTLGLSLPLGRNPAGQQARARRLGQLAEARAALDRARQQWRVELQQARTRLEQARAGLSPREAEMNTTRQVAELAQQAWQAGEITLRELLLARGQARQARLQWQLARHELAQRIRALNHLLGASS